MDWEERFRNDLFYVEYWDVKTSINKPECTEIARGKDSAPDTT